MKKTLFLIFTLLFSSLATAQWCTGTPDQNIDAARANFKAACGETYDHQKGHACDYKPDGYHCNGNISASVSSPTQTPFSPTAIAETDGGESNISPAQGQNLTAPTGLTATKATSMINLSWNQVSGAAGYNVYRNGSYLDTVSGTDARYSDNTAPVSGSIEYYVTAFDASKQDFSSKSNTVIIVVAASSPSSSSTSSNDNNNTEGAGETQTAPAASTSPNPDLEDEHDPQPTEGGPTNPALQPGDDGLYPSMVNPITGDPIPESSLVTQDIASTGDQIMTIVNENGTTITIVSAENDPDHTDPDYGVAMDPQNNTGEIYDGDGNFIADIDVESNSGIVVGTYQDENGNMLTFFTDTESGESEIYFRFPGEAPPVTLNVNYSDNDDEAITTTDSTGCSGGGGCDSGMANNPTTDQGGSGCSGGGGCDSGMANNPTIDQGGSGCGGGGGCDSGIANNPTGAETGGGAGDGSNTVDNGPTNTDGPGVNDNDSSGFPGSAEPTGRINIDVTGPTSVVITWESWGTEHGTNVRIYNEDDDVNPFSERVRGEKLVLDNLKPNTRYRANFQGLQGTGNAPWVRVHFQTPPE